jgi:two-component system, response regulator PdtaR
VVLASGADFHVLFTDVQMPGPIDGVGVALRVREQRPGMPIVMTSGHGVPELPAGGRFVSKPYDNRKVVKLLSELVAA